MMIREIEIPKIVLVLMLARCLGSRDLGRKTEERNLEALALNPINPKVKKVKPFAAPLSNDAPFDVGVNGYLSAARFHLWTIPDEDFEIYLP